MLKKLIWILLLGTMVAPHAPAQVPAGKTFNPTLHMLAAPHAPAQVPAGKTFNPTLHMLAAPHAPAQVPAVPPVTVQAGMVTVSWYPGALRGYSQAETQKMIIEALQQWQAVCGVQFGAVPPGYPTRITIYPYTAGNPPWAMAAYPSTGQILYSTTANFKRDWAVMAFAHEIGHCFGWGHTTRPEAMMFTRGSSVMYMDYAEGRQARTQFGLSRAGYHWPYSLRFVGDRVRLAKADSDAAKAEFGAAQQRWDKHNTSFEYWREKRDSTTDQELRVEYNNKITKELKARTAAGATRAEANSRIAPAQTRLTEESRRWNRIKREWDSINGIRVTAVEGQEDGPVACFAMPGAAAMGTEDLIQLFQHLPTDTVPLEPIDEERDAKPEEIISGAGF